MLRLEQRVFPLQLLQTPTLATQYGRSNDAGSASKSTVSEILPPLRQHERVDLECMRHDLHLKAGLLAQLHRRDFELRAVLLNLPRP